MSLILTIALVFAVLIKIFPPKKPNYLYGYSMGSAKKSSAHFKVANKYAANYLITLYSLLLVLTLLFNYIGYNGGILCLVILVIGVLFIYFLIEKKLHQLF